MNIFDITSKYTREVKNYKDTYMYIEKMIKYMSLYIFKVILNNIINI